MHEIEASEGNAPEIIGFVGMALAILGICVLPRPFRLLCLLGASFCLPVSFHLQADWPPWSRWVLSLLANAFLAVVAFKSVHE